MCVCVCVCAFVSIFHPQCTCARVTVKVYDMKSRFRDQRKANLVGQVLLERLATGSHWRKTSEIGNCLGLRGIVCACAAVYECNTAYDTVYTAYC